MMTHTALEQSDPVRLPTPYGEFTATAFTEANGKEHILLTMGLTHHEHIPCVRLHSECLTGDVFGSLRCDCGEQLHIALTHIAKSGTGALLYLRQEGRGIGLANKIKAYALQDQGMDTVQANLHLGLPIDARDYRVAAEILKASGMDTIRLMTNNPAKVHGLSEQGINVVERLQIVASYQTEREGYIAAKHNKLGHLFGEL